VVLAGTVPLTVPVLALIDSQDGAPDSA